MIAADSGLLTNNSCGENLVNKYISIYWDGDCVYYPAKVLAFDSRTNLHRVKYMEGGEESEENLTNSQWKYWENKTDNLDSAVGENRVDVQSLSGFSEQEQPAKQSKPNKSLFRMNYSDMVVEAVFRLNDKTGSSLQAIRKFIQSNFAVKKQQVTSFNNLTLKALSKAVVDRQLENVGRNTYKLTNFERDRRRRGDEEKPVMQKEQDDPISQQYAGTILDDNKSLRAQLLEFRKKRDDVLWKDYREIVEPFLQQDKQNYFERKMRREAEKALAEQLQIQKQHALAKVDAGKQEVALQFATSGIATRQGDAVQTDFPRIISVLKAVNLIPSNVKCESVDDIVNSDLQGDLNTCSIAGKYCLPILDFSPTFEDSVESPKLLKLHGHQDLNDLSLVWPGIRLPLSLTHLYKLLLTKMQLLPLEYEQKYFESLTAEVSVLKAQLFPSAAVIPLVKPEIPGLPVIHLPSIASLNASTSDVLPVATGILLSSQMSSASVPANQSPMTSPHIHSAVPPNPLISFYDRYVLYRKMPTAMIIADLLRRREFTFEHVYYFSKVGETEKEKIKHLLSPNSYSTYIRGSDGDFLPHVFEIMKLTQSFAVRESLPVSNMVSFRVSINGEYRLIRRIFCDNLRYQEVYKSAVTDTLRRLPVKVNDVLNLFQPKVEEAIKVLPTELEEKEIDQSDLLILKNIPQPVALKIDTITDEVFSSIITGANLHDYQKLGISWMVQMFKLGMPMILGDQMGLGKTIQTIGFINYLLRVLHYPGPFLVVVPLSVLSNWASEIEKFAPSLRVVRFHGPKDERNRLKYEELYDLSNFDVIITTFEMFVVESKYFRRKCMYSAVIVDEGHRLKNNKNQLSEKLKGVPTFSKVILTGTPLQNNLRELWALLHFLAPEIFTTSVIANFEAGFDLNKGSIDNTVLRNARKLLTVFMLRRTKADINIKLPSKREISLFVKLTPVQLNWYKRLLCSMDKETISALVGESLSEEKLVKSESAKSDLNMHGDSEIVVKQGGSKEYRKLMNLVIQLRKVCNHSFLLPHDTEIIGDLAFTPTEGLSKAERELLRKAQREKDLQNLMEGSGKLAMLDRLLKRFQQDGHRTLIFSQFTSMLDILQDYCDIMDYKYVRLDGETNRVQRRLDVRRFNAPNSELFIFLISTRAGGLGLNLASADTVVLFDSDWNPQVDLQAMERVHRIGQTKPVRIYRLVCKDSVEERIVHKANKKLYLSAMVGEKHLDESREIADDANILEDDSGMSEGITMNELVSLVRYGAKAILDSMATEGKTDDYSDEALDDVLERKQGRDSVVVPSQTASPEKCERSSPVSISEEPESSMSDLKMLNEFLQTNSLKSEHYAPLKLTDSEEGLVKKNSQLDLNNIIWDGRKRERKERLVMVDGKGTGYGGAIPILADSMEEPVNAPITTTTGRVRMWTHMSHCALCGLRNYRPSVDVLSTKRKKGKRKTKVNLNDPSFKTLVRCAFCPVACHPQCMENTFLNTIQSGLSNAISFVCSFHRCAICYRTTASAGGILFRCTSCITAYCEDCLPDDEIESVGAKHGFLEEQCDFYCRQAYYIKCTSCCAQEGIIPRGVCGDRVIDDEEIAESSEESETIDGENASPTDETSPTIDNAEGEGVKADEVLLPSQYLRLHWIDNETEVEAPQEIKPTPTKKQKLQDSNGDSGYQLPKGYRVSSRISSKFEQNAL